MNKRRLHLNFWLITLIAASFAMMAGCAVDSSDLQEMLAPVVETELASLETHTPSPIPVTPTLVPTETPIPTETPSLTPTSLPTATSTPTWVFNEAGQVVAPILLYSHVAGEVAETRYHVSVPNFETQMQALLDWGYTPIPISLFIEALVYGAELPEKPIVITFDGGHGDVYENAFPIMAEYGFPGVVYIPTNRLASEGFIHEEQIAEMINSGWEIGSNGKNHIDLTINHDKAKNEILDSKLELQDRFGIEDIQTFAYPFGLVDKTIADKTFSYGYEAAMGLGKSITHSWGNLFYLQRIEVYGDYTMEQFETVIKQ